MTEYQVVRNHIASRDVNRHGNEFAISRRAEPSEAKDTTRRRADGEGGRAVGHALDRRRHGGLPGPGPKR
jgi:hypothetical protein